MACIYIVMTVITQIHKHHWLETVGESPSQLQELCVYDASCTFLDLLEIADTLPLASVVDLPKSMITGCKLLLASLIITLSPFKSL